MLQKPYATATQQLRDVTNFESAERFLHANGSYVDARSFPLALPQAIPDLPFLVISKPVEQLGRITLYQQSPVEGGTTPIHVVVHGELNPDTTHLPYFVGSLVLHQKPISEYSLVNLPERLQGRSPLESADFVAALKAIY